MTDLNTIVTGTICWYRNKNRIKNNRIVFDCFVFECLVSPLVPLRLFSFLSYCHRASPWSKALTRPHSGSTTPVNIMSHPILFTATHAVFVPVEKCTPDATIPARHRHRRYTGICSNHVERRVLCHTDNVSEWVPEPFRTDLKQI